MPVYICLRGDCAVLALTEPGCFVVKDTQSRDWLCYRSALPDLGGDATAALMAEMLQAQARSGRLGLKGEGSEAQAFDCPGPDGLADLLGRERPPAQKSEPQAPRAQPDGPYRALRLPARNVRVKFWEGGGAAVMYEAGSTAAGRACTEGQGRAIAAAAAAAEWVEYDPALDMLFVGLPMRPDSAPSWPGSPPPASR